MATYVIADIHGEYDMFLKHPIKTMQKIEEVSVDGKDYLLVHAGWTPGSTLFGNGERIL
ncbi:MAG: hypothetical protein IJ589_03140 [Lachnospiraceae bacterium]|nr:hypothetical protein [Lachnospiraceae bacterium]